MSLLQDLSSAKSKFQKKLLTTATGGVFKAPVTPQLPDAPEEITSVREVQGDPERRRRLRKRFATGGRQGTILSGIQAALKKRLGE